MAFKMNVSYTSFLKDIMGTIEYKEKNRVRVAAGFVKRKMRKVLNTKKRSLPGDAPGLYRGKLRKGVQIAKIADYEYHVGFAPPAHHAHILEFGTRERVTKSGKKTGHVKPRPFFRPTMEASKGEVFNILNEKIF